jgi:elongation factor Ts
MAEITASMVKDLREKSGAGMMDCKKALTEAGGDFDKAMALLRERGEAIAVKRGGRSAKEGLIAAAISADARQGALIELNCESDFVARNDDFKALADRIARHAVTIPEGTDLGGTELDGEKVNDVVTASIGKIGENIVLSRSAKLDSTDGIVVSYIHPPGKIGVLVEFANPGNAAGNQEFQQVARGIAMHVAAANPTCVHRDHVDPVALEAEKAIFRNQALNEGKPEAIVEKIIGGRISKYYAEICLLEQPYVQEPEKKVQDVVNELGKATGADSLELRRFVRFQLGGNADGEGEGEE